MPTEEGQSSTSPARQMLEALALASREMTRKLDDTIENASLLNQTLESRVDGVLADISRQSELIVSRQLAALSVEKDSMLAELNELRRQELSVVRELSNNLKSALADKLNDLVSGLRNDVKTELSKFKDRLEETENDVTQSVGLLRMALREKLSEQLSLIQDQIGQQEKQLGYHHSRRQKMLAEEAKVSKQKLLDHNEELQDRLKALATDYLDNLNKRNEEILAAQEEQMERRLQSSADLKESIEPQIRSNLDFTENIPSTFVESCKQIAELQFNLNNSMAKNLSSAYRMEILSIAGDTEDKMTVVQSHMHSALSEYLNNFNERSSMLLADFESRIRKIRPSQQESEEVPQDVSADLFLDKIKKEVRRTIEDSITSAKEQSEQNSAEFRNRLSHTSQTSSELVERCLAESKKKCTELAALYKEELNELSRKVDALEQLLAETRELNELNQVD